MDPRGKIMGSGEDSITRNSIFAAFSANVVRVIKSRRLRLTGHVARMEEGRSAFKILTGKPTGKRPLGRPRRG